MCFYISPDSMISLKTSCVFAAWIQTVTPHAVRGSTPVRPLIKSPVTTTIRSVFHHSHRLCDVSVDLKAVQWEISFLKLQAKFRAVVGLEAYFSLSLVFFVFYIF